MAITCLDNLVGVDKRCTTPASLSGLYLNGENGLPSFSLKIAEAAMGGEVTGPVQFAQQMIDLAQEDIVQRFREHLQPFMKHTSVLDNDTAGEFPNTRETIAVTREGGWKISIRQREYLRFDLHSIELFWNTTATVNVTVYDLLTGNILDIFPIDVVANVPTEEIVSTSYSGDKIILGILTEGSGQPFKVDYGCTSCPHSSTYVTLAPADKAVADSPKDETVITATHAYGMRLRYSLSCDVEPFICNLSPMLAFPLRYAAARNLYMTVANNMERYNSIVTIQKKKADFWEQYYEGKFEEAMKSILQKMDIPECLCFACDSLVRRETQVP